VTKSVIGEKTISELTLFRSANARALIYDFSGHEVSFKEILSALRTKYGEAISGITPRT
jgi:hypothetical protein